MPVNSVYSLTPCSSRTDCGGNLPTVQMFLNLTSFSFFLSFFLFALNVRRPTKNYHVYKACLSITPQNHFNRHHTLTFHFPKIILNIILPFMRLHHKLLVSLQFFFAFIISPHAYYMPRPSDPAWFDRPKYTGEKQKLYTVPLITWTTITIYTSSSSFSFSSND